MEDEPGKVLHDEVDDIESLTRIKHTLQLDTEEHINTIGLGDRGRHTTRDEPCLHEYGQLVYCCIIHLRFACERPVPLVQQIQISNKDTINQYHVTIHKDYYAFSNYPPATGS